MSEDNTKKWKGQVQRPGPWAVRHLDTTTAGDRWSCAHGVHPQLRCTVLHSTQASAETHCEALNRELHDHSDPIRDAITEAISAVEDPSQGGEWLGAARKWLQWHHKDGERVTWGSGDVLEGFSVRNVEDLARAVALATLRSVEGRYGR